MQTPHVAGVASARAVPKLGFGDGLSALFGGFKFVMGSPSVWPFAAVPMIMFLLVAGLLSSASVSVIPDLVGKAIGPASSKLASLGAVVLKVVAALLGVVLSLLLAFGLAQPLSGPALETLVRKREQALGAPERPKTPFFLDMFRALKSVLVGYGLGLPPLAMLFLISTFVPPATVITVPLKLLVSAFTIAWDVCDYPLTVHGLRVRRRLSLLSTHWKAVLGFSTGLALAGLVPCMLFLFLPAGVAGATELVRRMERDAAARGESLDGQPLLTPRGGRA